MEQAQIHLMGNYGERILTMQRGEGVYLYDTDGHRYLDFTAGIAVCSLGHAHPTVTSAISRQAATLIHCSNLYENAEQNRLASRLARLSGLDKVFFCNSGTEANEAAMKLVRKYFSGGCRSARSKIVSLPGGFHGRTFGALSITGKPKYQAGFEPLVPDCVTPATMEEVPAHIDESTAACFVEVIQGEGGVRPVPNRVLHEISERCKAVGALLVIDEVQTGVGRTGSFFAYEQVGLDPDVVTIAKGLAGGVPIGAMLARAEVAQSLTPGSHGTTFGGNPLACATANAVLDVVTAPESVEHIRDVGAYLGDELHRIGEDVQGNGLMWGISVPDAKTFVNRAARQGVLLSLAGDGRVRFVPPFIVERKHVDEMIERLSILV